jgi:hypothetical protein
MDKSLISFPATPGLSYQPLVVSFGGLSECDRIAVTRGNRKLNPNDIRSASVISAAFTCNTSELMTKASKAFE